MEELESVDQVNEVLPHDLIAQHILTRLHIKSLLNLKSVSKQWYKTLSSPHFALSHFNSSSFSNTQFLFIQNRNNYYLFSLNFEEISNISDNTHKNLVKLESNFDDDGIVLIGSCNGLVCLASFNGDYFILWNPFIGKFHKYVDIDVEFNFNSNFRVSWGFGYVLHGDDYKIVRIVECPSSLEIWVDIFSLKSNKWTRISDKSYQDVLSLKSEFENLWQFSYLFHSRQGVLVNETLYWIVSKMDSCGRKIIAFDLGLEKFYTVEDFKLVSNDVYRDKFLCVVGGCLSKCGVHLRDDVDVSVLEGPRKEEVVRLSRNLGLRSCQSIIGFRGTSKLIVLLEDSTIGLIDETSTPVNYKSLVTFEGLGKSRFANFIPSLFSPYVVETRSV